MYNRKNILEMISLKNLFTVFYSCIAIAVIFAICFGSFNRPNVSLVVFATGSILIIMKMMSSLEIKPSKKVYYLLIPITLLSISNILFVSNSFLNFVIVIILILIFTLCHINKNIKAIFNFELLMKFFDSAFYVKRGKNSFSTLFNKSNDSAKKSYKILIGIAISIPFVFIILSLLASADAIFNDLLYKIIELDINIFSNLIVFIFAFIMSYIILLNYVISSNEKFEVNLKMNMDSTIISTFLVCINFVFLVFCFTQLGYVIFKDGFYKLPDGMTYAQYARSGFFQLLFVSVINFSVITIIINFMKGLNEDKRVKMLLKLLVVFTLVLVVSSLYRIKMYTDAFGFTQLRLQVIVFLVVNFILLILTFIKLHNFKINIGKQITIVVLLGIIANSYVGNGFVAAKLNIDLYNDGKKDNIDVKYNNSDYSAYINYAYENKKIKKKVYSDCESTNNDWQEFTLSSLLCD